jgi:hypothetical protein
MRSLLLRLCVLTSAWFLVTSGPVRAQTHPALALTIVPTTYASRLSSEATISFGARPHFHVLLTNLSAEPVTLFEEWNSWGYDGLSFELTYADGRKVALTRAPRNWYRNYPSTLTLAPQGYYVFEVRFDQTWVPSLRTEPPAVHGIACRLRARYTIAPAEQSLERLELRDVHPWAGTVASEEKPYIIWP